jgi:uncharacterized protein YbjT (DUF2867 family)
MAAALASQARRGDTCRMDSSSRAGVPGALLAGATGLVGRALLSRLLGAERGQRVVVVARAPLPPTQARDPRLLVLIGDMAALAGAGTAIGDVYIAVGTTIKVAGSEAAFRAVDLDLVVAIARAARAAGASRLGVVSALGADRRSRVFYNRVKGEMEDAVGALGYASVVIARPSLLLGDRTALGQPPRRAEVLAARVLGPLLPLVPARVRPVAAETVAAALIAAVEAAPPGTTVLSSAELHRRGGG